jgi:hypothetical protein
LIEWQKLKSSHLAATDQVFSQLGQIDFSFSKEPVPFSVACEIIQVLKFQSVQR